MERHGSESYVVLGEGLLDTARGGRLPAAPAAALDDSGATVDATHDAEAAAVPPFRFSRMGPKGDGRQLGEPNRRRIAEAMTTGSVAAGAIPAGFTYLGQFVDHDLSFDRTQVMLGTPVTVQELVQARSPSLDLDSLYGGGPHASPRFYAADKRRLRTGTTAAVDGLPARPGFDLPRGTGATDAARKAVIPDPRNDENLAVAQTHLAFIRFHNRVLDTLPASVPAARRFATARELVIKHYQWMLRTDFLPRIVAPAIVDAVFAQGRKAFEVGASPQSVPTMPIEFSVAAYRLGHSMIREAYNWNRVFDDGAGTLEFLFDFSGGSGGLSGDVPLPTNWIADFRRLYDFGEAGRADLKVPARRFNRAMRIDTTLVDPLRAIRGFRPDRANLAFRNLTRASQVTLATGQQMVDFMRSKGLAPTRLTEEQILGGRNGADLGSLNATQRTALVQNTPLWFYVLREAEFNGGVLRNVGGRIVAETFHRAIEGSRVSILRDPAFRPSFGPDSTTFRMVDLLLFAFEGREALLNPLGD